jgi:hypothetical protein
VASLEQRLWSSLFDSLLAVSWILFAAFVQPWPSAAPGLVKLAVWIAPPLLCEPVSIRLLGHTAGQGLVGLRVRSTDQRTLRLGRLLLRHALKLSLLGVSLFYAPFSRTGQAVHDYAFNTVVVSRHSNEAPPLLLPREPFRWRQFLLSLMYCWVASTVAALLLLILILSSFIFLAPELIDHPAADAAINFVGAVVTGYLFITFLNRRAARVRLGTPPAV